MGSTAIIALIDKELARLHKKRAGLVKQQKDAGSGKKTAPARKAAKARHQLSPEGRARIAEAQRKRWAAARNRRKG